jgi:hypothetical protein
MTIFNDELVKEERDQIDPPLLLVRQQIPVSSFVIDKNTWRRMSNLRLSPAHFSCSKWLINGNLT